MGTQKGIEAMNQAAVPTIDFEPFLKGGPEDRMAVAEAIDTACIETGFFAITGHGVPESEIEGVRAWVAPVGETAGHPTDQPEAAIQPPQQQPSGIRCDDSAIEPGHNLVPFNRFKFEQCWATLCLHRGLSGIAVSDWRIAIFRDSPPRCIKGFEKSGLAPARGRAKRSAEQFPCSRSGSAAKAPKCRLRS